MENADLSEYKHLKGLIDTFAIMAAFDKLHDKILNQFDKQKAREEAKPSKVFKRILIPMLLGSLLPLISLTVFSSTLVISLSALGGLTGLAAGVVRNIIKVGPYKDRIQARVKWIRRDIQKRIALRRNFSKAKPTDFEQAEYQHAPYPEEFSPEIIAYEKHVAEKFKEILIQDLKLRRLLKGSRRALKRNKLVVAHKDISRIAESIFHALWAARGLEDADKPSFEYNSNFLISLVRRGGYSDQRHSIEFSNSIYFQLIADLGGMIETIGHEIAHSHQAMLAAKFIRGEIPPGNAAYDHARACFYQFFFDYKYSGSLPAETIPEERKGHEYTHDLKTYAQQYLEAHAKLAGYHLAKAWYEVCHEFGHTRHDNTIEEPLYNGKEVINSEPARTLDDDKLKITFAHLGRKLQRVY